MTQKSKKQLPQAKDYIPHLSFDSVIFGFNGEEMKILILEYHNTGVFALPGGFVKRQESINDAVHRAVFERTGLGNIYLEQFYVFGDVSRKSPDTMRFALEAAGHNIKDDFWMLDRFITVAFYALINYNNVVLKPDELSDSINWYPIDALPELQMDHADIVRKAIATLKENIDKKVVGMNLLPEKFTMKELQLVYEAILGEKLHRTAFQRKMLAKEILLRHDKLYAGGAHKAPYLYSFKDA